MNIPPPTSSTTNPVRLPGRAAHLLILLGCMLWLTALTRAQTAPAANATASDPGAMTASYGAAWNTEAQPDLAAFNHWAQNFTQAATGGSSNAAQLATGIGLARQRQAALVQMMPRDPARVLSAGVPAAVRAKLPPAILSELETPFSALGDYTAYGALRALGGPDGAAVWSEIKVNGHVYRAYVYGRRVGLTTKRNIFLHGILLGNAAVLAENVLRVLPANEAPLESRAPVDLSALAGATDAASTGGSVLAEAGGTIYRFASEAQLHHAEASLRALESAHRTPETANLSERTALEKPASVTAIPDSAYTTGNKAVLIIRVDFSDLPGEPSGYGTTYNAAYVQNLEDTQIAPYYKKSSFGLTTMTDTVATPLYRMPRTASSYATAGDSGGLHSDAEALANADYDVSSYDRIVVEFSSLGGLTGSQITYGGLGEVGGPDVWVNGEYDFRVLAHEFGHTYGLIHGDLWQVTDGNPISPNGTSVDYGDDFDTIGGNPDNSMATDFNLWYKTQLAWVPLNQIQTVTTSGTYRISQFDGGSANGIVGLEIIKDGTRNYWVGIRRNFTSNNSMSHGVYLTWGYNTTAMNDDLLDMETPGNSDTDAALPTGTTFTDTVASISITPLDEGGTAPNAYEDVQVTINVDGAAPVVNSATTASGTVGQSFSYQITATGSPTSYSAINLPAGLSVDTSTGVISGSPTVNGTFLAAVAAINASGTGSALLTITTAVSPNAPTITSFSPTSGLPGSTVVITGTNFSTLTGINFFDNASAAGSYTGTQVSATVPGGAMTGPITIFTGNGTVSTATNFTVINPSAPVINSAPTASGQAGVPFSYQITAINVPTNYAASNLPAGLSVDTTSGLISGTPTVAGTASITLSAVNIYGTGTATLAVTILPAAPTITSFSPSSGQVGTTVTINGTNLSTTLAVVFAGNATATGTFTDTQGTVTVPGAALTGPITLTTLGGSATTATSFTVLPSAPVVASATASAEIGVPFSFQITATESPANFGAAGFPAGLSVTTAGLISGTPLESGTFTVELSATNGLGTGTGTLTLTVTANPSEAALIVAGAPANEGTVTGSGAYTIGSVATLSATSSTGWQITGITVTPAENSLEEIQTVFDLAQRQSGGAPVTSVSGTVLADRSKTVTFTFGLVSAVPAIGSASTAAAQVGVPFSYQVSASNSPTLYAASGLPGGVSINPATGLVSGVPTQAGVFPIGLSATNSAGTGMAALTLTVAAAATDLPVIGGARMATARLGEAFAYQIAATHSPRSFAALFLPNGLSVNPSTGLISGKATREGTFSASVSATNADGTGTADLIIKVLPPLPVVRLKVMLPAVAAGSGRIGEFTLTLSVAQTVPVTVKYNINGTAINGVDYEHLVGQIKFGPGTTSKHIKIIPEGDRDPAATKTVAIRLKPGPGYQVGTKVPRKVVITPQE